MEVIDTVLPDERACIERLQALVYNGTIRAVALDFDDTITIHGTQRGGRVDEMLLADNVFLDNIRHPRFLRAFIYGIYEAGGRVCIVSFQDDLTSNPQLGVTSGRYLIERYIDALLGEDRPADLLQYDQDYLLWNPAIRCGATRENTNKNNHLIALAMWSGRRDTATVKPTPQPRLKPDQIVFIDDSATNVAAANVARVARGFVATNGVNAQLCDSIVRSITQPLTSAPSTSSFSFASGGSFHTPHPQQQPVFGFGAPPSSFHM